MSDFVRDAVLKGLKAPCITGYAQTLDERRLHFSDDEKTAVRQLRESAVFQAYPKDKLDRHEIKYLMGRLSTMPIGVCESAASKCEYCIGVNLLDENLVWNKTLAAEMSGVTLTEGMASSMPDKQGDDKGMYGIGSGADKSEPKGQADSGTSQKSDHGDHSKTADKKDGYVDEAAAQHEAKVAEMEKRHAEEKAALEGELPDFMKKKDDDKKDEGELPDFMKKKDGKDDEKKEAEKCDDDMSFPKKKDEAIAPDQAPAANKAPSPTNDGNTAATDARYKHGAKQNETVEEMEARHAEEKAALEAAVKENAYGSGGPSGSTTADPKASTPGDGEHGTKAKKGTSDGETPGNTPNLAKVKEQDPSNDPKNKGPAQAKNESFEEVETRLVAVLTEKGYEKGTPQYERAYKRGFDMWVHERARSQNGEAPVEA
jgi:hypothetical protein